MRTGSAGSHGETAILPFTPSADALVYGALADAPVGSVTRAESYLLNDSGVTRQVAAGRTVTFEYDFTPVNLETQDSSAQSWTTLSQLIGPAKRTGSWDTPIAAFGVARVDGVLQYTLSGTTNNGIQAPSYQVTTGIPATTGVTRHVKFTTVLGGPGVGRTQLEIDGRVVASARPSNGMAVNQYTVAKYGLYSEMAQRRATADRWAVFESVEVTVERRT